MFISKSTEKDFVPQTERKKPMRSSLRLSNTNAVLEEKFIVFIRGSQQRNISLAIYPKQGVLLQVLREEFSDPRLSYFYDPIKKKELDYNGLWDTNSKKILVLEDSDNVDSLVRAFLKD